MGKVTMSMKAYISPMPAILIGTVVDDKPNFMTAAWVGVAAAHPATITVGINPQWYTYRGAIQNMAFSVNIPSENQAEEVDICGNESGVQSDKIQACKFNIFYGKSKTAPLIEQCPVNLECRVIHTLDLGSHTLFVARVEDAYISEEFLSDGRPDIFKIKPIIFNGGGEVHYCSIGSAIKTSFRFAPPDPPQDENFSESSSQREEQLPPMKNVFKKIWTLALPYQDKRDDPGHAEITLRYARKLVALEKGNEDIVIPAIILHDVGWSQLLKERRLLVFDREAKEDDRRNVQLEHQNESERLATEILHNVNYPEDLTDEILEIISQHDTREGFISKNEGLVRDADKLWRTSPEGLAVKKARDKLREDEQLKKIEEGINKPNYLFSETAKQLALADIKHMRQ